MMSMTEADLEQLKIEARIGRMVLGRSSVAGWKNDGETALEFLLRTTSEAVSDRKHVKLISPLLRIHEEVLSHPDQGSDLDAELAHRHDHALGTIAEIAEDALDGVDGSVQNNHFADLRKAWLEYRIVSHRMMTNPDFNIAERTSSILSRSRSASKIDEMLSCKTQDLTETKTPSANFL